MNHNLINLRIKNDNFKYKTIIKVINYLLNISSFFTYDYTCLAFIVAYILKFLTIHIRNPVVDIIENITFGLSCLDQRIKVGQR